MGVVMGDCVQEVYTVDASALKWEGLMYGEGRGVAVSCGGRISCLYISQVGLHSYVALADQEEEGGDAQEVVHPQGEEEGHAEEEEEDVWRGKRVMRRREKEEDR